MNMPIADFMKPRVITIEMDDSIAMVHSLMKDASINHLPVIDSNRHIIGIVSDRDLLRAMSPFLDTAAENNRDLAVMRRPVHQIMTRRPQTALADTPLNEAARLMLDNNISSLPVTSEEGLLIGIITWKDLVGHCASPP